MWETYKMWRMMRLLKKHQHEWGHSEFEAKENESSKEKQERIFNQIMEITKSNKEPDVIGLQLSVEYIKKYCPQWVNDLPICEWKEPTKDIIETKSIILDCKEKGFINFLTGLNGNEKENPNHLHLTFKGKKFATIEGLLKEWIVDDIGILWSVIVTIIGSVSITNFDWIIKLTGYISPWW